MALGLTACDDDGPTQPAIAAGNDTVTVQRGQNADLLANDSFDGGAATAGAAGNVTFALTSGSLPSGVTVSGGQLAVSASAAAGSSTFAYTICEAANGGNCATASVQLVVPLPAIAAAPDTLTLAVGSTGDVLANDRLGGAPASSTTVVASATTPPGGIALSPGGLLTVSASAAAGSYSFGYRICQTDAPTNCADSTVNVTVPASSTLSGRAVNSSTGAGIAGVTVTVGGATATTDSGGNFTLAGVPAGDRVNVLFVSPGYATTERIARVSGSGTVDVQARLVPVAASVALSAAAGGTASVGGSTAQAVLPANSVRRADGSTPGGNVTVSLTPLNPVTDAGILPGDYTTLVAGAAAQIESLGALWVRLLDELGAALSLQTGQFLTLRIPAATRGSSLPATVPLFRFDEGSGRWVEEGSATLSGAGDYYQGVVARTGVWAAARTYGVVRVSGCVADAAGVRLAGAAVTADGIDYSGTSSALTDASGNFVLPIRNAGLAAATAVSAGRLTNTVRLGPYSADAAVTSCLTLGQAGGGVTVKLTWSASPSDLDSHLITPSGARIYYASHGSLTSSPFANLDVDDTSSFGPEVVTVSKLMVGTYKYAVNNFSGQSSARLSASGARVELNIPNRAAELYLPPTTGETLSTDWWQLFEFDVAANCTVTVRRLGTYSTASPSVPAGSTPVYCTAP